MLQELLFPEVPEPIEDYTKTDLTVQYLLDAEREKQLNSDIFSNIDETIRQLKHNNKCQPLFESKKEKRARLEEERSKLKGWFGMKKVDIDKEAEQDLTVMKLRRYLDPKSLIKDNRHQKTTFYEVGTEVQDSILGKRGKKGRQGSLLDEMKAIDGKIGYSTRKFQEIQEKNMKNSRNRKFAKLKRAVLKK